MANREIKGLSIANIVQDSRAHSGKMAEGQEQETTVPGLLAEVERLRAELSRRDGEVAKLKTEVTRANAELGLVKKPLEDHLARLEQDLEQAELRGKLTMLRALDGLCTEHQKALLREAQ